MRNTCHLPNCIGSVDGSFFRILQPPEYDRAYHCYKKYYAIIVMAIVDKDLRFVWFSAGTPGSLGDANVWNASEFSRKLHTTKRFDVPPIYISSAGNIVPANHPNATVIDSYVVADSAFHLSTRCIKCYDPPNNPDQALFNEAVKAARQRSELGFGRYSGRWKIVKWNRVSDPQFAIKVAQAAAALHNICQLRRCKYSRGWEDVAETDEQLADRAAIQAVLQAGRAAADRPMADLDTAHAKRAAVKTRAALCTYVARHPLPRTV